MKRLAVALSFLSSFVCLHAQTAAYTYTTRGAVRGYAGHDLHFGITIGPLNGSGPSGILDNVFNDFLTPSSLSSQSGPVHINLTDVETGYKAFRGDIIRNMVITSSRFGFEIEVTAKIAKLGCIIYEIPISYYGRTYAEGKKIGLRDGIQALWPILLYTLFYSPQSSFRTLPRSQRTRRSTGHTAEDATHNQKRPTPGEASTARYCTAGQPS